MTDKLNFIDCIAKAPCNITTHRHSKHGNGYQSPFDIPYYLITWKCDSKTKITIQIDGPDFYDQERGRNLDKFTLGGLYFTNYTWYGLRSTKTEVLIKSLSEETRRALSKRGKELVYTGDLSLDDLTKFL